ncbi:hypothetical protein AAHE18_08G099600 [Arachis hypogaea]
MASRLLMIIENLLNIGSMLSSSFMLNISYSFINISILVSLTCLLSSWASLSLSHISLAILHLDTFLYSSKLIAQCIRLIALALSLTFFFFFSLSIRCLLLS